MLPATAAMTAEIAGAAAARRRAVSRSAIRGATGRKRPARETRATIDGVHSTMPNSPMTRPARTRFEPCWYAPANAMTPPRAMPITPRTSQIGRDRADTPATAQRRDDVLATGRERRNQRARHPGHDREQDDRADRQRIDAVAAKALVGEVNLEPRPAGHGHDQAAGQPDDRGGDPADDAVREHDSAQRRRRTAGRCDQGEVALAAAGSHRERRSGQQYDFEQTKSGHDRPDTEQGESVDLGRTAQRGAGRRMQQQIAGDHLDTDVRERRDLGGRDRCGLRDQPGSTVRRLRSGRARRTD